MNKPVLIIMAAGLGSRYGGLKQIAPVDTSGHIIMDYSIYDARRAGFETVICVINREWESDFRAVIGDRVASYINLQYAFQNMDALPAGFSMPQGRTKPWGTAHAVLSAKHLVNGPFAVINADDFYGKEAFMAIYKFLVQQADDTHHAMVGYKIENTLTENGAVARGICQTNETGRLVEIIERTHIEPRTGGAAYTEDGRGFTFLPDGTTVSMNLWGFGQKMMSEFECRFSTFLRDNLANNPLKCEYFLPSVPNALLREEKVEISVLPTTEKWYGITYVNDMPAVQNAIAQMKNCGIYPQSLWEV